MMGAAPAGLSTAVAATFAVSVAGVVVVVVAGAAFGSVLACSGAPACPESGCELAAMAAAAIASGGVEPPEEGVAAGTFVAGVVTGMTTATGFGVVAMRAACWARI